MAAKVQCTSRFALLKVEDDDSSDDGGTKVKTANQKASQQASNAKKRNKKKKKIDEGKEKDELRNLAFGKPGQKNKSQNSNSGPVAGCSSSSTTTSSSNPSSISPSAESAMASNGQSGEQWEEWKRLDTEHAVDSYERDLQQAMLQSKLDYQQKMQFMEATKNVADLTVNDNNGKDTKKKKKKNILTLDEFNKLGGSGDSDSTNQNINGFDTCSSNGKVLNTSKTPTEDDRKFFDKVDEDTSKIVRKELIQEEYRKQYVVENARTAHYQKEMDKKDKEIAMLKASLRNMDDELKQVKKRNKQLCVILAQGEMKDKADVLMQLEDLTMLRDEMTEQLTDLTGQLEKERSKVHMLQKELDKGKGGKHSKS